MTNIVVGEPFIAVLPRELFQPREAVMLGDDSFFSDPDMLNPVACKTFVEVVWFVAQYLHRKIQPKSSRSRCAVRCFAKMRMV